MPAQSNFQDAIREAQASALVGPNVVNKALPYVGGGMILTAVGAFGGLSMVGSPAFWPLFGVALIGNLALFFVAQGVASRGDNNTALPLLALYSLITGFTLSGLVAWAKLTAGIGGIGAAALATGATFLIASVYGRRMSDSVGQALGQVVGLGIIGLLIAMVIQLVLGGGGFGLMIAGFGTVLFTGAAFLDFYTMPRTYRDDQYLAGALSMYLTYINLFIFILQLVIALSGSSRD
ncbi:MAG: Bax inhibitor-1 family protein [Cyanobacteria bacterium MAG CAR1_bin_15]|nr:Bax inhibitor-1 family protein [Cyanobacteria bacterium MAG CAR1_bin_15]